MNAETDAPDTGAQPKAKRKRKPLSEFAPDDFEPVDLFDYDGEQELIRFCQESGGVISWPD